MDRLARKVLSALALKDEHDFRDCQFRCLYGRVAPLNRLDKRKTGGRFVRIVIENMTQQDIRTKERHAHLSVADNRFHVSFSTISSLNASRSSRKSSGHLRGENAPNVNCATE